MSDMTQEQIIAEFKRQVLLCSGIGKARMLAIVHEHFDGPPKSSIDYGQRIGYDYDFTKRSGKA
jgi:hypothetical protein